MSPKTFVFAWIALFTFTTSSPELIVDDPMDSTTYFTWTLIGSCNIPSSHIYCDTPIGNGECFEFRDGCSAEKSFSTIGYQSVNFSYNTRVLNYESGDEYTTNIDSPVTLGSPITSDSPNYVTWKSTTPLIWADDPDFKIKFELAASPTTQFFIGSFKMYGIPIGSPSPTTPSLNPTDLPTLSPTQNTLSPSTAPSHQPSQQPTGNTLSPTMAPSKQPSKQTSNTLSPTKIPTASTFYPTISHENDKEIDEFTTRTGHFGENESESKNTDNIILIAVIIIIIVILLIFICALIFYYKYRKRIKEKHLETSSDCNNVEVISVQNIDDDIVAIINKTDMGTIHVSDDDIVATVNKTNTGNVLPEMLKIHSISYGNELDGVVNKDMNEENELLEIINATDGAGAAVDEFIVNGDSENENENKTLGLINIDVSGEQEGVEHNFNDQNGVNETVQ